MAWIGVDLGGTKIYAVALEGKEVVAEAKAKTPRQGGPFGIVDAIGELVASLGVKRIEGVGVGAPGVVDADTGVVQRAPNLPGWMEPFGLGAALSEAMGTPVVVDNDVNVGIVAEHRQGAAVEADNVLGVFVGTGVGGGLILDGKLRRGPSGVAGELGHVVVRRGGRLCGCGGQGHLEAYAGRASMERRARELEAKGRDTKLVDLAGSKRMTSSVFSKALAAGDPVAIDLIDDAVTALGAGIASALALLDLELVVIGGGMADRLGDAFVGRVEQAVRAELFATTATVRVMSAQLGDRGGAIGAALVAGST